MSFFKKILFTEFVLLSNKLEYDTLELNWTKVPESSFKYQIGQNHVIMFRYLVSNLLHLHMQQMQVGKALTLQYAIPFNVGYWRVSLSLESTVMEALHGSSADPGVR